MWISEFACGVIATVLVEVVAFIIYAAYDIHKKRKEG